MNWDDFRYVLALARGGTLAKAATSLGVHYTSVARRIERVESDMGARLFDHGRREHVLTDAGQELVQVAERMENEVFALDRELLGKDTRLSGPLRIATVPSVAGGLAADMAEFAAAHPDIDLQITCAVGMHNLTRREADVALRVSGAPPPHLIGRRVTEMFLAPFAAQSLVDRMGDRPLSEWPWIRVEQRLGGTLGANWLNTHAPGWTGPMVLDDYSVVETVLSRGVAAGFSALGLGVLYPQMVQIGPPLPHSMGVWVLTHPDLRGTARVRAFMQFIAPRLKRIYTGEPAHGGQTRAL